MRNRCRSGSLLLLAGSLALLATAGRGVAQSADEKITGTAELGWRSFIDRPSALQMAKFEEYRDMSPGPFLQAFRLELRPDSVTHWELRAADAFRRDQALAGSVHRAGLFDLRLGWDQIPHTLFTTSRMLGSTTAPFTLPSSLTRTLADTTAWKQAPSIGALRKSWNVAQADITLTPGTHNDLKAEFTSIAKSGSMPMSMSMSAVSLYREVPVPLDQSVRDVKLSESYVRQRYQVQVAYDLNAFHNANESVTMDNPLLGASSPTAGSSVGRGALPPSNLAQTFTVAGGLNLPLRTRFNSTLSYSRRTQNEPFIPYTSNTALTDPRLATEPRSLNGDVRTVLANLTATTHPLRDVSVTARYRYWDFGDHTATFTGKQIPLEVITDRSITAFADTTAVTERFPYTTHNAGLEVHWRPLPPLNVQAGYAWERWNRSENLEATRTDEYTPRLSLDLAPADWVSLRGAVSHSRRRNNGYPDDAGNDNFAGFRRFNMADRDRTSFDGLVQLSPDERFGFSGSLTLDRASYPNSPYGVQSDHGSVLGGDVSYMVGRRLTLFGSYTYEIFRLDELNKYRDGQNTNNPTYDYRINERDIMQTAGAGLTGTLVPRKLDVEVRWDRSRGATLLATHNPRAPVPSSGTPTQQASSVLNATATDFPEISHTWTPFHASLRYQVNNNWSAALGFSRDAWQSYDFRTAGLGTLVYSAATPPAVSGVPLGNDLLPYTANYLTFSIGFRPSLSRAVRPIL